LRWRWYCLFRNLDVSKWQTAVWSIHLKEENLERYFIVKRKFLFVLLFPNFVCIEQNAVSKLTSTKRYLLIFMQFRLVARPCKLATKSNSTACSGRHCRQLGRHCRKRVIFVARMSNVLSTFGRLCRIRQNRPCRIRFVASVYRALSSDISESFRGANLRFFYIDE